MKKMSEKNLSEMESGEHVGILLTNILLPAMSGGLSEKEATEIYNKILQSIDNVHSSRKQFDLLIEDITNKLILPLIAMRGIKINPLQENNLV